MNNYLIWPCLALAALVFVVWIKMYRDRLAEIRAKHLSPGQLATSAQSAALLENSKAADNLRNLFELPVLFYVAAIIIGTRWPPSTLELALAWIFVGFRWAHSLIHITANRVMWRFAAYLVSTAALFLLWVDIAWRLAAGL